MFGSHPRPKPSPNPTLLALLRDGASLSECICLASTLPNDVFLAFLVWMALDQNRKTNRILGELTRMALNDADLTQAVTDLTGAFTEFESAVADEVADLKAAITPETDQAIVTGVAAIEGLVAKMKADTAAAKAAVAPPAPADPAPAAPADGSATAAS